MPVCLLLQLKLMQTRRLITFLNQKSRVMSFLVRYQKCLLQCRMVFLKYMLIQKSYRNLQRSHSQLCLTYPTVQLIQPMPYRTSLHRQMQFRKKLNLQICPLMKSLQVWQKPLISLHRAVKILSILLLQLIYLLRTEKWLLISLLTLTTIFHRCILLLL